MAASNILSLPFRRTHPVNLSPAIKQYISSKYDQHPDMFARDLETIDKLRTDAINVLEPHQSGIRKLSAYAAQLVWIGGKFPVDIGAEFTWYPALGYNTETPTSQNNLRFELANVLYNLASLYTQLAVALNRSTTEGIRSACNYFSQAAGVISCLKITILPDMRSTPPEDMDTMTLESLEQLLLAQSQECFWQKAVMAGLKDHSIAKLAAKVSDYYSAAGDYGIKSNSITSEWLHHMTAKHHHFASAAQYRAACDALEKRKYGEEVARLRDSLVCVDEALKEARYLNKVVLSDLHGLKSRVQEDLKRAEKDNDMIYLIPVPPKSELKPLDRVNMATVKIPDNISNPKFLMGEHGEFGRPLFAKLVPFAVHVAASIYDERRDRLVSQTIIEVMEKMTSGIHDLLQSLNLPAALEAIERPLGLPHNLVGHAEEVRQHDGLNRIRRSMEEISQRKDSERQMYMESVVLLRIEAEEDEAARAKYGTDRWSRPSSTEAAKKLYVQAEEIDGYLRSAETTDELVKTKVREHEQVIRLLGGSDRELSGYVPCSQRTALSSGVQLEASRLRSTLNECSRQESRRRRKAEALREKAKLDDITTDILAEAARLERDYPLQKIEPDNFEDLFARRLQRYDADRTILNEEQAEQEKLEQKIKDSNRAFLNARRGDSSTKEREQALQSLEKGYHKYKEILNHLDVGQKFYNDLAKIVGKFRDECREWAWKRRAEAVQIESDHVNGMNALNLTHASDALQQSHSQVDAPLGPEIIPPQGHTRQQPPVFQSHTFQEKPPLQHHSSANPPISSLEASQQLSPQPSRQAHMSRQPNAPGPVPGMWTPELGIKFGAAMPPSAPPDSTVPQPQRGSGESRDKTQPSVSGQWNPSHGLNFR